MHFIVGLGNPGKEYENTRHNVGFAVLDSLVSDLNTSFTNKKSLSCEFAQATIDENKILLCKPQTFMNVSGRAVGAVLKNHPVTSDEVLVIYDDADLDFGDIRFKASGSSAGHNGMESVLGAFARGTSIARIRVGIGRPSHSDTPLESFVLQKWTQAEQEKLPGIIEKSKDLARQFLNGEL